MPEPNEIDEMSLPAERKWADYNQRMVALFAERNLHPVDSPERTAVAERILALWVAEGG